MAHRDCRPDPRLPGRVGCRHRSPSPGPWRLCPRWGGCSPKPRLGGRAAAARRPRAL